MTTESAFDSRRFFSYLFIVAIAILFALQWGPGSQGCGRNGRTENKEENAATVNGKAVPLKDFTRAYLNTLARYRAQGITPQLAKQLGLHTQVLEQVVNGEVLAQAAEARGIQASDQELLDILKKNPEFQKDGAFDVETYHQVLSQYYRRTYSEFEKEMRRQMSAQKLLDLVESSAAVAEDEVKAKYWKEGDVAAATWVRFSPAQFAEKVAAPKPAELSAWSEKNEGAIAQYYQANQSNYFQPERIKARQILIRATKDDGDAKRAEAKTKLENVRKEIEGGKDFAQLATAVSEDPETKGKGGDMGFVERISLPRALAEAAFVLKAGEMTQVIETPLGYHLIKVEEQKAAETKPLESVKKEIAETVWRKEKATELAKAEAAKALAGLKAGKSLADLYPKAEKKEDSAMAFSETKAGKPEATETGEFNSGSATVPQLGVAPELQKAIFALEAPAALPQTYTVQDDLVVVAVTSRKKPSESEYESKKAELANEAVKGKQFELRESFVKSLRKQAAVTLNNSAVEKATEG